MNHHIIAYIFIYFILSISVIGFGFLLIHYSKSYFSEINLGEIGILGILFLVLYSQLSHLIFAHSFVHNLILIVMGFLLSLYFLIKDTNKNYYIFFVVLGLIFISFPTFKSHDDFSYYHFPYTFYLTQYKHIFGLGIFNHGFRTPSSIFYLNSLFYIPYFEYYLFNLSAVLILAFANLTLTLKLIKIIKNKEFNLIFYLILFILIFINIFFYRISEHGTDRSAQILILLLFLEYIGMIYYKINIKSYINKILVYIAIIISLKAFYFLYVFFLFPLIFFLVDSKNIKLFKKLFFLKNLYFNLLLVIFLFVLFVNFSNSGCLLYPVSFTCLENYSWSIPVNEVKKMNMWYEQWSKAGAGPNFRVSNPEIYIQQFNWVSNWIDKYFFNKVLDFLGGLCLLILFLFICFYKKGKSRINFNNHIIIFYLLILLFFFEWFYNHPSLRYGGYVLVFSILVIPAVILLDSSSIKKELIRPRLFVVISLVIIIFLARNVNRIDKEYKTYDYNLIKDFRYNVKEDFFRIDMQIKERITKYDFCIKTGDCNEGIHKSLNFFFLKRVK